MATNFTDKNISSISLKDIKYNLKSIPFHGTTADWEANASYIPKKGEIIIYDADEYSEVARVKIGDGINTVSALPFWQAGQEEKTQVQIITWEADD